MEDEGKEQIAIVGKQRKKSMMKILDVKDSTSRLLDKTQTRNQISERVSQYSNKQKINNDLGIHLQMKDNFNQLYQKINKISHRYQHHEKNQGLEQEKKPGHQIDTSSFQSQLVKVGSRSIGGESSQIVFKRRKNMYPMNSPLKVKSVEGGSFNREEMVMKFIKGTSKMRLKQYEGIYSRQNTGNRISDFLSVQRLELKDIEDSLANKSNKRKHRNKHFRNFSLVDNSPLNQNYQKLEDLTKQLENNLLFDRDNIERKKMKINSLRIIKKIKFVPPFQTYYYRDLLWKVAYSNQQILQFPLQYDNKIKVFVGRGNNSRLIHSIINRRPWMQATEKIEEATIFWTQLKVSSICHQQIKNKQSVHESQTKELQYYTGFPWSQIEAKSFNKYFLAFQQGEQKMNESMNFRNRRFEKIGEEAEKIRKNVSSESKTQNHMMKSFLVGNKKALYKTMSDYYSKTNENVFDVLPLTFHICNGLEDDYYLKFLNTFYAIAKNKNPDKQEKHNVWIVKPGQNTNCGQGITVCLNLESIKGILKKKEKQFDGTPRTYIIQKYIEKPLLYKKRKFDLRHYMMINCRNGFVKGYWYKEGYVRTSSSEFTLRQGFSGVHLTNDSIQKNMPDYGKHEKGNKISYEELNDYLKRNRKDFDFFEIIYPRMKKIATDIMRACAQDLDPEKRNNFQIYGIDFMVDQNLKVWLLEVNTNPCLSTSCPVLSKIIPKMIQSTFQICIDPVHPPPTNFIPKTATFKQNCSQENGYELVFDDRFEQQIRVDSNILFDEKLMKQEDDCFDDDGEDYNED